MLWFDAHNGLQMHPHHYTGLYYVSPAGRSVYSEYKMLMAELSQFISGSVLLLGLPRALRDGCAFGAGFQDAFLHCEGLWAHHTLHVEFPGLD